MKKNQTIQCLFLVILICVGCKNSSNEESVRQENDSLSKTVETKLQEKSPTKIEENFIWLSCYPKEKRFDGEKRLVQSKGESGDYRTMIEKVKEYDILGKHKAYAIFCTYSVDEAGKVYDSHASAADISIARFVWNIDKWELEKFIENWKTQVGAWGEGPKWTFKAQEGREIFGMKWMYGNHGNFEEFNEFYDVETLEKVKLQKSSSTQNGCTLTGKLTLVEGDREGLIMDVKDKKGKKHTVLQPSESKTFISGKEVEGAGMIAPNSEICVEGKWENHADYGKVLIAKKITVE